MNKEECAAELLAAHAFLDEIICRVGDEEQQIEMIRPEDWEARHEMYICDGAGCLGYDVLDFDDLDRDAPIFWGTSYLDMGMYTHKLQLVSNDPIRLLDSIADLVDPPIFRLERAIPRKGVDSRWLQKQSKRAVTKLKRQWAANPVWYLPSTAGFEAHWHELDEFENNMRKQWAMQ